MAGKPPLRVVPPASTARHSLRILIADDDRDTTTTLAAILREEGHDVQTVLRGDEILGLCRLLRPEVVIADVDMPGMSGYAVARELRERHSTLCPLLIAISGKWTKPSDVHLGHAVGFDHYLLKPADPNELLAVLAQLRTPTANEGQKSAE